MNVNRGGRTHSKEDENGTDGGLIDGKRRGVVKALVLVALVRGQAQQPGRGLGRVGADGGHGVVLEDKDNAEEDDVRHNNKNNSDTAPLQLDDAAHAAVGLAGCHGADAVAVGGQARVLGRSRVVVERGQVDLDAVAKRDQLHNNRHAGKDEQRDPQVGQAVVVVDVAGGTEAEGDAAKDDCQHSTKDGDAPAGGVRHPHEAAADDDLPANLQVQGQRSQKHPHDGRPAAENKERAGGATDAAGVHAIGRDGVIAFLGVGGEGDDEAEVQEADAGGQADAEVVAMCLIDG